MHADRPLPHNVDAERGMLGAILLDNSALNAAIELLKPEDFFLESHRRVFRCMVAMDEGGQPIDLLTLASELERRGDLEAVGGSPYVSQLIDGVPRLTNVEHYAQLVRQASLLRSYAHAGEAIRLAALQQGAEPEKILGSLRELLDRGVVATKRRLRAVSAEELLQMNVPPREMILNPILPTQGLVMLYSKRGVGKTFIALAMAHAVATGGRFLQWSAPKARSVLYVDGELPATTLRERLAAVIAGAEPTRIGGLKPLRLITPDLQDYPLPDLATREGQLLIEAHLDGVELIILDNLSALCRSGKENEGESWLPIQGWALRLRQRGISVLFEHHAGKGGAQRGTSRREDVLDTVIVLRHPADYSAWEGLRCEVHFEKCRGFLGADAKSFEVRMETNCDGAAIWTSRQLDDVMLAKAGELFGEGLSIRLVAEELGISKSKAHRLKKRAESFVGAE